MVADLSHSDWLVLGALSVGATHGFAVSTSLAKDGDLGRIWSVRRPMVYQSVGKLVSLGLVTELATERSNSGPSRTPLEITASGQRLLADWLVTPVEHLREMRPLLLTKLALLERLALDPQPLLERQRAQLETLVDALPSGSFDDVDRLIVAWRNQVARAVVAFLDERLDTKSRPI